jgi:hypothetical protein
MLFQINSNFALFLEDSQMPPVIHLSADLLQRKACMNLKKSHCFYFFVHFL